MKEEKESVLVLCDQEEEYARLLSDFLRTREELPWTIHAYSDVDKLMQDERDQAIDILLISERTYQNQMAVLHPKKTVILMESGVLEHEGFVCVSKYQQAQNVFKSLLEVYLEIADTTIFKPTQIGQTIFIGIYSPIRRCFQTTFALTLGQMLSAKYRTLYLNFEHFCGISELAAEVGARDLADLLYFMMADKEKFLYRLETIVQHVGTLDYVPPMKSGQNLLTITAAEWAHLLQKIAELNVYQYVILDLTESMQGLFEILRDCRMVFTLTREDRVAQGKLAEYERILERYSYGDILQKTKKCVAPQMRKIPESIDQFTKGDLAEYIQKIMDELEGDGGHGLH